MERQALVSTKTERMKNKKYEVQPQLLSIQQGYVDPETKEYKVSYQDLRQGLKKILKRSYYKIQVIIDTYVDLGLMRIENNECIFNSLATEGNFVSIPVVTARFLIDQMSEFNTKVYCWFLNKYQIHKMYNFKENYFFTKKEILEDLGLVNHTKNRIKLTETMQVLKNIGAIDYADIPIAKNGEGKGLYTELYKVNSIIKSQEKAVNSFIKEEQMQLKETEKNFQLESIKEKAESYKNWLDSGMSTWDSLNDTQKEIYISVYGERF